MEKGKVGAVPVKSVEDLYPELRAKPLSRLLRSAPPWLQRSVGLIRWAARNGLDAVRQDDNLARLFAAAVVLQAAQLTALAPLLMVGAGVAHGWDQAVPAGGYLQSLVVLAALRVIAAALSPGAVLTVNWRVTRTRRR